MPKITELVGFFAETLGNKYFDKFRYASLPQRAKETLRSQPALSLDADFNFSLGGLEKLPIQRRRQLSTRATTPYFDTPVPRKHMESHAPAVDIARRVMNTKPSESTEGLVTLDKFLEETGLSHTTGWRYRKRGWLDTINIAGRLYVCRSEILRFLNRARSGEFARLVTCPDKKGVKS